MTIVRDDWSLLVLAGLGLSAVCAVVATLPTDPARNFLRFILAPTSGWRLNWHAVWFGQSFAPNTWPRSDPAKSQEVGLKNAARPPTRSPPSVGKMLENIMARCQHRAPGCNES